MNTIETILKSPCGHLNLSLEVKPEKKRSKYGANKKEVDGILFHSEKEAARYGTLKLLLKAGKIGLLELQMPFELNYEGSFSYKYIADFVYIDSMTGKKIVEDCKGFKTAVYKKKKKLMKELLGIEILET